MKKMFQYYIKKLIYNILYISKLYLFHYYFEVYFKKNNTVTIVTYHRVLPREKVDKCSSQKSMVVSLENFREQLDYIAENYHLISIDDYSELDRTKKYAHDKPYAIIAFDDGWSDNYLYAFKELRQRKIPAVIYLASNYINTSDLFWPEKLTLLLSSAVGSDDSLIKLKDICFGLDQDILAGVIRILSLDNTSAKKELINNLILELKDIKEQDIEKIMEALDKIGGTIENKINEDRLLTWDEVKEMSSHGICFGSHTLNHKIVTKLSRDEAADEIVNSKKQIEKKLGSRVDHFSFPNGEQNEVAIQIVRDNGYMTALSGLNGINDFSSPKHILKRKGINEERFVSINGRFNKINAALELSDVIGMVRRVKVSGDKY